MKKSTKFSVDHVLTNCNIPVLFVEGERGYKLFSSLFLFEGNIKRIRAGYRMKMSCPGSPVLSLRGCVSLGLHLVPPALGCSFVRCLGMKETFGKEIQAYFKA